MKQKNENLLYRLPETTVFDGTNYIDTEVDLNQYSEYTVMLDVSEIDTASANNTLFDNMTEKPPYPGWVIDVRTGRNCRFTASRSLSRICQDPASRNKIVVRRSADGEFTLFTDSVYPSGFSVTSYIASGSVNHTVYLGAYYNNGSVSRYTKGTMHDCKIYSTALSDDEITTYLNS